MLTSEELFPPEYCFAGSCSSHLARPPFFLPASVPLYILRVVFPPSLPSRLLCFPHLLHGDIVLTRLGTCNLFVPHPARGERAALGRCTLPCTVALSSSLGSSLTLAKSVPLARHGGLLCACICAASPLSLVIVPSAASVRNNIFF